MDAHAHITAGPHKIELLDGAPAITIDSVDEITQFTTGGTAPLRECGAWVRHR